MNNKNKLKTTLMDSMVVTGIGLAGFYWVCESFMYFFLEPEANFIQHVLGPDMFQTWTRLLVLCLFLIFGSHVQYTVNKRRAADDALRESEEKYRTILESIEEGCFETDIEGNLTFFSNPFLKILGYSRNELLGGNTSAYTSPDTAASMERITERLRETGKPENVSDYDVIRKDGTNLSLELSVSLLKDQDGLPMGYRGVLRDVSERKKTEEEKHKLESQLQQAQKMESIGTLAGGIAHDFNNILMGIQGNASLMLLKIESDHPNYEKIKNIEKYVQNGTELTKQLLGFARRGKYLIKATDLNEIIDKSSSLFARTKKEIRVHATLLDDLWTAEVDRGQIEQVLLNLYVNAWQAMSAKSSRCCSIFTSMPGRPCPTAVICICKPKISPWTAVMLNPIRWSPAAILKSPSLIPAWESTKKLRSAYLSLFLPQKKWAGEPAWGWPRFMAS
jgi:PAS domain S-box-containing protein